MATELLSTSSDTSMEIKQSSSLTLAMVVILSKWSKSISLTDRKLYDNVRSYILFMIFTFSYRPISG